MMRMVGHGKATEKKKQNKGVRQQLILLLKKKSIDCVAVIGNVITDMP